MNLMLDRSSIRYISVFMNKLSIDKRAQLISCLVEGNSLRATSRITGIAVNTVAKFLVDVGTVCANYQDKTFQNLTCKRIQCDEIWAFVGCKERNVNKEKPKQGWGDAWTWTAICTETKLVPCWFVGPRDATAAMHFIRDLKGRLANRVQLTTDGLRAYVGAVDNTFKCDVDFAQLVKIYGDITPEFARRYSPSKFKGAKKTVMTGGPDEDHISTSYVERQNLTMRMGMRRFTRLTNGHSKKLENHACAVGLHFMHYNFCRIHTSLRCTPAMAAGITSKVWSLNDIADLLDVAERLAA